MYYGYIECPYCKHKRKGTWDDAEGAPFTEIEFQCDKCEEFFLVDCEIEVQFNFCSRKEQEGSE